MSTCTHRIAVVATACLAVAALVVFARITRRTDRCIGDIAVLERLLNAYATDHAGKLPISADALIDEGYCRRGNGTGWEVHVGKTISHVRRPEWFDIAWGSDVADVRSDGTLASTGRLLVQPAERSGCSLSLCEALSMRLAARLRELSDN